MSIPLDHLYHYIENIVKKVNKDIVIYRFYPHGSKNLDDLNSIKSVSWQKKILSTTVYCCDQEPLNYNLYLDKTKTFSGEISSRFSIRPIPNIRHFNNLFNRVFLIHSEKRSTNVNQYQEDLYIPVYYWSHALISRDWFRFAQHIEQHKQVNTKFLIYNRAWAGTREYRLKFSDLILRLGLESDCLTTISPIEPELGIHYEIHQFNNPAWRPTNVLENFFSTNTAQSHYSADFDIEDYEATDIEIVLETLFDDSRLHLTEKSLRPIACGQPFILASTHGSLEYLRSYGFKTYGHIWDERYDLIEDPYERLVAIVDLMKQIANWAPEVRERKMAEAQIIAEYNKNHFFSKNFFDHVVNELISNVEIANTTPISKNNIKQWIDHWTTLLEDKNIYEFLKSSHYPTYPTLEQLNNILQIAKTFLQK